MFTREPGLTKARRRVEGTANSLRGQRLPLTASPRTKCWHTNEPYCLIQDGLYEFLD